MGQIDEIVRIEGENVDVLMQKGDNLSKLCGRVEELKKSPFVFRHKTRKVKTKKWWEDIMID